MAARGRRHRQMAEDVGVSVRTLPRWLSAYQARGVEGLNLQWASGRVPRIPEAWASEMLAWVTPGPAGCRLDRATWTYPALAAHLYRIKGIAVSERTLRTSSRKHGVRPCGPLVQPLAISQPTRLNKQRRHRTCRPFKKAAAGELVLRSQDEARFSLIPTLRTTLGLKGHRPLVGHLDGHDLVYVFGALTMVTGRLTTRLVERGQAQGSQAQGVSRQRHMPAACARH
jgi:transposase